jgi:NCS2 family nucleobase:cation symporter-2
MPAVYGSMLASGLFGLLVAVPFAKVVRFIPPLVSGVIITVVGFSLIGVAAKLIVGNDPEAKGYADPQNLALSAGIILTIVVFNRFARGFLKQTGVLVALVGGTLVAIPMGLTDFSSVSGSDWVGVSTPFHFGAPEFPPAAVISMCVVMLVIFTESTASMLAVAEMTEKPLKNADLARGLAADGLSGVIGGAMNGLPDTLFGQNIGLVGMSGIRSRYVTATAGGILVLLGLVPKMGEFVACLPGPVIGSAGLVMFGMVAAIGVDTLRKVDLSDGNNLMIAAVSLGVGMLPVAQPTMYDKFPDWVHIIAGSAITSAAVMAFCLNLLFNHMPWGRSEEPVALPDLTTDPGEKAAKQPA